MVDDVLRFLGIFSVVLIAFASATTMTYHYLNPSSIRYLTNVQKCQQNVALYQNETRYKVNKCQLYALASNIEKTDNEAAKERFYDTCYNNMDYKLNRLKVLGNDVSKNGLELTWMNFCKHPELSNRV